MRWGACACTHGGTGVPLQNPGTNALLRLAVEWRVQAEPGHQQVVRFDLAEPGLLKHSVWHRRILFSWPLNGGRGRPLFHMVCCLLQSLGVMAAPQPAVHVQQPEPSSSTTSCSLLAGQQQQQQQQQQAGVPTGGCHVLEVAGPLPPWSLTRACAALQVGADGGGGRACTRILCADVYVCVYVCVRACAWAAWLCPPMKVGVWVCNTCANRHSRAYAVDQAVRTSWEAVCWQLQGCALALGTHRKHMRREQCHQDSRAMVPLHAHIH